MAANMEGYSYKAKAFNWTHIALDTEMFEVSLLKYIDFSGHSR